MTTFKSDNYPKAKGERFKRYSSSVVYTVESFFGASGIEYNSLSECRANNKKGLICIKILETGGYLPIEHEIKDKH